MKAAIFDPYLDTLGGGERYVMTFGYTLIKNGWKVDVIWNEKEILRKLENRLGLDLSGINVLPDISKGKGYDLCFWLSDGSIPTLWARKNILHFQVPFHNVNGRSFLNRIKLQRIHAVVCNSEFTKKFIDREYGVNSIVLYPPVAIDQFKPGKKENVILSVARFSQLLQEKHQDILIDVFKKMVDGELRDWKLILAGGSNVGGRKYVDELKKQIAGYPIEIVKNPPFNQLKNFYAKAKIFWSATGFGIDEDEKPEKVEHFGISVVEAMAAGCVPVVFSAGGHKEIVVNGENGFLWNSKDTFRKITFRLTNDEKLRYKVAQKSKKRSQNFSQERFEHEIIQLIA